MMATLFCHLASAFVSAGNALAFLSAAAAALPAAAKREEEAGKGHVHGLEHSEKWALHELKCTKERMSQALSRAFFAQLAPARTSRSLSPPPGGLEKTRRALSRLLVKADGPFSPFIYVTPTSLSLSTRGFKAPRPYCCICNVQRARVHCQARKKLAFTSHSLLLPIFGPRANVLPAEERDLHRVFSYIFFSATRFIVDPSVFVVIVDGDVARVRPLPAALILPPDVESDAAFRRWACPIACTSTLARSPGLEERASMRAPFWRARADALLARVIGERSRYITRREPAPLLPPRASERASAGEASAGMRGRRRLEAASAATTNDKALNEEATTTRRARKAKGGRGLTRAPSRRASRQRLA